jgi:hypothetical protein
VRDLGQIGGQFGLTLSSPPSLFVRPRGTRPGPLPAEPVAECPATLGSEGDLGVIAIPNVANRLAESIPRDDQLVGQDLLGNTDRRGQNDGAVEKALHESEAEVFRAGRHTCT